MAKRECKPRAGRDRRDRTFPIRPAHSNMLRDGSHRERLNVPFERFETQLALPLELETLGRILGVQHFHAPHMLLLRGNKRRTRLLLD